MPKGGEGEGEGEVHYIEGSIKLIEGDYKSFNDVDSFFRANKYFLNAIKEDYEYILLIASESSDVIIIKVDKSNKETIGTIIDEKSKENNFTIEQIVLLRNYGQYQPKKTHPYTNLMINVYKQYAADKKNTVYLKWDNLISTIKTLARGTKKLLHDDGNTINDPLVIKYYVDPTSSKYAEVLSLQTTFQKNTFTLNYKVKIEIEPNVQDIPLYNIVNVRLESFNKKMATLLNPVASGISSAASTAASGFKSAAKGPALATEYAANKIKSGIEYAKPTLESWNDAAQYGVDKLKEWVTVTDKISPLQYAPETDTTVKENIKNNKLKEVLEKEIKKININNSNAEKFIELYIDSKYKEFNDEDKNKLLLIIFKIGNFSYENNIAKPVQKSDIPIFMNNKKIVTVMLKYNFWFFPKILEYIKNWYLNEIKNNESLYGIDIYKTNGYLYYISNYGYINRITIEEKDEFNKETDTNMKLLYHKNNNQYMFDLQGVGYDMVNHTEEEGNGPEEDNPDNYQKDQKSWGFQYSRLNGPSGLRAARTMQVFSSYRDNIYDRKEENVSQNHEGFVVPYIKGGNRKTRKHRKNNNRKTHKMNKTKNRKIRKNYRKTRK